MKTDQAIIAQLKKHKKQAERGLGKQRSNTKACRAFYAGDYQEYTDKIQFATTSGQKKKVTVQINKIKPYVSAVKGFLAQNRRKPNYIARMQQSQAQAFYSKYANELSEYLRGNMNADQVETQQDGDMLTCGLGVVETAMTYGEGYASRSANGEIMMSCIDLDTYWYDPTARETNLLDRRYDGVSKIYHIEDALDLFNDSNEEDFDNADNSTVEDYQYQGDLGAYDRIKYDWADQREGMVNVHFYNWYDIEPYYRADNPVAGLKNPQSKISAMMEMERIAQEVEDNDFDPRAEILSFNAETKEKLLEVFAEFIEPEEFRRKCFYTAISSGDKVFKKFKSEHQDGFTIKVKTGDYDAKNKIWTGMVNSMMEPQKYYNKALTELMFVIAANSKGGVIIEEDAVEDIEEFEDQYAKTDAVCVVRSGALAAGKVKDKRTPFQPTGYEQIIQIADVSIADVSGIDRTFLGSSENKMETAQLQRQRIRQIASTLACYVDSICLFSKEHARLMLDLMRIFAANNRGELFRIMGQDKVAQFIQISDDKLAGEFDVVIEEAPVTPEERQEMADKLTAMGDKLALAGDVPTAKKFYAMATRYMALDSDDMLEMSEMLVPDGQEIDPMYVKQLEDQVKQLSGAMTQAQVDNINAMTQKTMTDAQLNTAKMADVRATVHKKSAETTKTLEDAEETSISNEFTKAHPAQVLAPQPKGDKK